MAPPPPPLPPRDGTNVPPPVPRKPYREPVQQQHAMNHLSSSMNRVTLASQSETPFADHSIPRSGSYTSHNQSPQTTADDFRTTISIKDLIVPARGDKDWIRQCPYPDSIKYPFRWYYAITAPAFFVCSNCFQKHISNTRFESEFSSKITVRGEAIHCNFAAPRSQSLWARSLSSNDFEPFKSFMEHRASIAPCHGIDGVNGTIRTKWFATIGNAIENFVACEACYEDVLLASSFTNRFQPHQTVQPADQVWACDVAQKYVSRAVKHYSSTNDWQGFVRSVGYRLKLAPCARYQMVEISSRQWYQPKPHIPGFSMCETCYFDFFALSPMEQHFQVEYKQANNEVTCMMGFISLQAAWDEACVHNNYRLWLENAKIVAQCEPCFKVDITDGTWYTLQNGFDNFDLCPSCYSCLIETLGFGKFFKKTTYPAGTTRGCDFSLRHPKVMKWLDKLTEAIFINDFTIVQDYIVDNANLLPCPRSKLVAGRLWYGNDDFLVCGECYQDAVRGTKLDPLLKYHNAPSNDNHKCDLYSQRMRGLWNTACQDNDLDAFNLLARQRNEVYARTVPIMENMLAMAKMRLMQAQNMQASAMLHMVMDAAAATRIDYGSPEPKQTYEAGDVRPGYGSHHGVDAARLQRQANSITGSQYSDTVKVGMLEDLWRQVE